MDRKILPVGLDSFEKIRRNGFYYIDKTRLIKEVLTNRGDVNLFTRPRRFGKTLNMSMLKSFFEIGTDKTLFDGLEICGEKQICEEYQGKGIGRNIIETLEQDEYFLRAKRIEIPASITGTPFYRKMGYDYKNGICIPDEEGLLRLEKYR